MNNLDYLIKKYQRNIEYSEVENYEDPTEAFLYWFLRNGSPIGQVPVFDAVSKVEEITSLLWFRKDNYQVQMFIVPPNYIIPEHKHPNVDSYEIYIGGQIMFSHNGNYVFPSRFLETPINDGTSKARGLFIRVRPNDLHGATINEHGAVFMSTQRWLNGVEPHCVSEDYDGIVMGESHFNSVKSGNPVLKDILTAKDAASHEH